MNISRKYIFIFSCVLVLLLCVQCVWAEVQDNTPTSVSVLGSQTGYYKDANGKKGGALFSSLNAISGGVTYSYTKLTYKDIWTAFKTSDVYPSGHEQAGKIWDMYATCYYTPGTDQGSSNSVECAGGYNREHSLPKSWFGGSDNYESTPQGCDLGHLIPTDVHVNTIRSNYAFGEVQTAKYTFAISKQGTSGTSLSIDRNTISGTSTTFSSATVFEPADEYKGDLARIYMYMRARYKDLNMAQKDGGALQFTSTTNAANDSKYGLTDYSVILLMKWHRQDPVSQKEIDRNNAMERLQGNRNPFIDYPILAEYLWGEKSGQTFYLTDAIGSFDNRFIPGVSDGSAGSYTPCTPEQPTAYFAESSLFLNIAETVPVNLFTTSSDGALTYTSSNTDVAEVDANTGTLTLVGTGTATITASVAATECYKTATAQYSVTVYDFRSLPATEVRSNSFTANWTEDKEGKYTLDVTYESEQMVEEERDTTFYSKNFSKDIDDWAIQNVSGYTNVWTNRYSSAYATSFVNKQRNAAESWLVSPVIDLSEANEASITLSQYFTYSNTVSVQISTDNGDTWSDISLSPWQKVNSTTFSNSTGDLSDYKGETIRLAFVYIGTTAACPNWAIQSIQVNGTKTVETKQTTKISLDGYPKEGLTGTSYSVTGLQPSTTYTYTVTPMNGTASDEVEVTTADCSATITIKSSNEALGTVEFVP